MSCTNSELKISTEQPSLSWREHWLVRAMVANRVYLSILLHLGIFAFGYWTAFGVRFDFAIPEHMLRVFWATLPGVLAVKCCIFYMSGSYQSRLRYVMFSDLKSMLRDATYSVLMITAADFFVLHAFKIPRTILLVDWALTILLIGGLRCGWRLSYEQFHQLLDIRRTDTADFRRAFIVGAQIEGAGLAKQIDSNRYFQLKIVGLVTPDPTPRGTRVGGVPVAGGLNDIRLLAEEHAIDEVLVMAGSLSGKRLRGLLKECEELGLPLKVIPNLNDLLGGLGGDGRNCFFIREVDIHDLLHREPVQLDDKAIQKLIAGRTVLVTGAGGSIGSEICRQVLKFKPRELVMVERAEGNLFLIQQELARGQTSVAMHPCVADVGDQARMNVIFSRFRPEVVFHAAAHKHVPLMEDNCGEAVKNNVFGTKRLADLADQHGVESFVLISTDKAVNPSSIMGVSKQLAERYIHAKSQDSRTKFMVVRFGNVLGSSGSVVPIFKEQVRRGGPITVTHPDMTRFFMTIPEASQLVLQAAAMGEGREIFVLDMGEPVKIVDLAKDLIKLSGLSLDDIEIVYSGTRPGEKLYEELYFDEEETLPTTHPKLRAAYHRPYSVDEVERFIKELEQLVHGPEADLRAMLREIVTEYKVPVIPLLTPDLSIANA